MLDLLPQEHELASAMRVKSKAEVEEDEELERALKMSMEVRGSRYDNIYW